MPSRPKDHLIYRRPLPPLPGRVHVHLYDGATKFEDIPDLRTGILETNYDYISPEHWDPNHRFKYDLRSGQYIENHAAVVGRRTSPTIIDPCPFIWRSSTNIRMPNFDVSMMQFQRDLPGAPGGWAEFPRHQFNWSDCAQFAPIGAYLEGRGQGAGAEYWSNVYYENVSNQEKTLVLQAEPGPGLYGLKYFEGLEAEGGVNTSNKNAAGRTVWQIEAPLFEPIGDVFFHAFDTTDLDQFKITGTEYFEDREIPFSFRVDETGSTILNVYLIPRQWYYFVYVLSWYMIITLFSYWYHPYVVAKGWYDRPPVFPYAYGPNDYWGPVYGGKDDYACYKKVIYHETFTEILHAIQDFAMHSWLMGIVWVGVEYFYYRVRSFPALTGQLAAVIEDALSGQRWYVWHRRDETRDTYTLVDCFFWPENWQI